MDKNEFSSKASKQLDLFSREILSRKAQGRTPELRDKEKGGYAP